MTAECAWCDYSGRDRALFFMHDGRLACDECVKKQEGRVIFQFRAAAKADPESAAPEPS